MSPSRPINSVWSAREGAKQRQTHQTPESTRPTRSGHINGLFFASAASAPAVSQALPVNSTSIVAESGGRERNASLASTPDFSGITGLFVLAMLRRLLFKRFMLYNIEHASAHLPADTALKDMVIELLLDVAG